MFIGQFDDSLLLLNDASPVFLDFQRDVELPVPETALRLDHETHGYIEIDAAVSAEHLLLVNGHCTLVTSEIAPNQVYVDLGEASDRRLPQNVFRARFQMQICFGVDILE